MSLATKYRPKRLEDVVGQELVVEALRKPHLKQSYLFIGKTGAGKTTTARILASMVDGHVIEVDAASNNSAESVRELIDSVKPKPLFNEHTVVILDECHALSSAAVQSLLKIIEQPPKHLMFILCTTEVDKVPKTIYNRCEVLNFVRVQEEEMTKRLAFICKEEGVNFTPDALKIVARLSDGSLRQAISNIERIMPREISVQSVREILLANSYDNYLNVVYAVLDKQYNKIAETIRGVTNIDKYVEGFFSFLLDISVYSKTKNERLIDAPSVYISDFNDFNECELSIISELIGELAELQYYGRNNPILKQLLIAKLYGVMK